MRFLLPFFIAATAAGAATVQVTVDRAGIPPVNYPELTLLLGVGNATSVTAEADGVPLPVTLVAAAHEARITTASTGITLHAHGITDTNGLGAVRKAVLKHDKLWAWSHGFDDNTMFREHGIPAFTNVGWRGTVYLIGSSISDTRDEGWILDAPGIRDLVQAGWAIGNHTWSHWYAEDPVEAKADILLCHDKLRAIVDQVRPGYRLMSFAAPMFDSRYQPVLLNIRDNEPGAQLAFNESGNGYLMRLDPGAEEPQYGMATVFDFDAEIGRFGGMVCFNAGNPFGTGCGWSDPGEVLQYIVDHRGSTNHYWLNSLDHGVDNDWHAGTQEGVFGFIPWLYANYGPAGSDEVLVAPAEEIYSYLLVRDRSAVTATVVDDGGATDLDGDGLPDAWEQAHFGGATNANPAATASNGVNTVRECYIAGLDPNSGTAWFRLAGVTPGESGDMVNWVAAPGRIYSVYRSPRLLEPVWTLAGTTTNGTFTDTNVSAAAVYRLGAEAPP